MHECRVEVACYVVIVEGGRGYRIVVPDAATSANCGIVVTIGAVERKGKISRVLDGVWILIAVILYAVVVLAGCNRDYYIIGPASR